MFGVFSTGFNVLVITIVIIAIESITFIYDVTNNDDYFIIDDTSEKHITIYPLKDEYKILNEMLVKITDGAYEAAKENMVFEIKPVVFNYVSNNYSDRLRSRLIDTEIKYRLLTSAKHNLPLMNYDAIIYSNVVDLFKNYTISNVRFNIYIYLSMTMILITFASLDLAKFYKHLNSIFRMGIDKVKIILIIEPDLESIIGRIENESIEDLIFRKGEVVVIKKGIRTVKSRKHDQNCNTK